jgi:hypothetical protein
MLASMGVGKTDLRLRDAMCISRPYWKRGKGPGSFGFLGFTHYWAKTLKGEWTIKRKTQSKRLSRFMSGIAEWCRENRHAPLGEQHRTLSSKLRRHCQYKPYASCKTSFTTRHGLLSVM